MEQASRRSSLSALSLASSIRPITKDEKDRENKNKSSPSKPSGRAIPGSARLVDNRTVTDGNIFARFNIRHHLERTTGQGFLMTCAHLRFSLKPDFSRFSHYLQMSKRVPFCHLQREKSWCPCVLVLKLEVHNEVVLRRRLVHVMEVQQREVLRRAQRRSRKVWVYLFYSMTFISFINIHFSVSRSQSVGPTVVDSGSPKKQPKPMSASVTAATASSSAKQFKRTPASTPVGSEHTPRPSKLKTITEATVKKK